MLNIMYESFFVVEKLVFAGHVPRSFQLFSWTYFVSFAVQFCILILELLLQGIYVCVLNFWWHWYFNSNLFLTHYINILIWEHCCSMVIRISGERTSCTHTDANFWSLLMQAASRGHLCDSTAFLLTISLTTCHIHHVCLFSEVDSRLSCSGVPSHDFYRNFVIPAQWRLSRLDTLIVFTLLTGSCSVV